MLKPKVDTRFKPGQSGNPNGRPRKSPTSGSAKSLDQILAEKIPIVENGKKRWVSKEEALLRQTVNLAFKGDARAALFVFKELSRKIQSAADPICPVCSEKELLEKESEQVEITEETIRAILKKLHDEC